MSQTTRLDAAEREAAPGVTVLKARPAEAPAIIVQRMIDAAAAGVAFSANVFTLYLFYEVITVFTYPLVAHHQDEECFAGARKYLVYLMGTSKLFLLPAMAYWLNVEGAEARARAAAQRARPAPTTGAATPHRRGGALQPTPQSPVKGKPQ